MSTPRHHPPEELLFDYANGACGEGIGLLVATHLALCPACRDDVAMLEQLGGELLDDSDGHARVEAELEALRDSLAAASASAGERPRPAVIAPELLVYPEPLRSYMAPSGKLSWTRKLPGFRYRDLDVALNGVPLRVSVLHGGLTIPTHTHNGLELNLVLHGGFSDRGDDYLRGDVAVGDRSVTHHLDIHRGEDCILLAANEERLVPMTTLGGVLSKLFGV
jgi:putative transcriptional regulator